MLPIVISPDPILATVCEPCEPGDKSLKRLSKQMAHAMYKNYGCGIAAPQVGVTKRLVVIDVDWDGEKGEKNPSRGPASSTTIWTASCGRSRATACSAAACSTRSTT